MTADDPADRSWTLRQIDAVTDEIERYLEAHPNATDSLNGVRDWWLTGLGEAVSSEIVQEALDRLTDAGKVDERRMPGGAVIYGRSPSSGK